MARSLKHRYAIGLAAIVILGFALRAWGFTWGLYDADISRRPHPDEWTAYWLFHWFGADGNLNPCPHAPTSCFFDWGMAFPYAAYGVHTLAHPLLTSLPIHVFGPQAQTSFVYPVLAGRATSLLLSTLTILVAYKLAEVSYGRAAGLVAASLVALSGLLVQLAHFATPDSTTCLALSSTLLATALFVRAPSLPRFMAAGFLMGVAVSSEYHMALLAIPITFAWILAQRRVWWWLVAAFGAALLTYCVINPYILIDFGAFRDAMVHTLRIRTIDSNAQYQGRWAKYDPAWLYVARYPLGYGVGALFAWWYGLGAVWAVVKHKSFEILLLSWIAPYFVLVSVSSAKFMRYSAPLLVPLAVLAAGLSVDLMVWLGRRWARVGVALALGLASAYTFTYDAAYAGMFSSPEPRWVASQWLTRHTPPSSLVGFEELPDGVTNLAYFITTDGFSPCIAQFQTAGLRAPAKFEAIDDYELEEHPRIPQTTVDTFQRALSSSHMYRVVHRVHYVPTFLGMRFPIDDSPHDWRYPSHTITVYAHAATSDPAPSYCFSSLVAAQRALYRPGGRHAS